jgi:integrase
VRGTIIKRGATYSVVLDLGRGPDGKRVRKWHSGYRTKKDAERAQVELLDALGRGAYVGPSKRTTGPFLREDWLPSLRAQVRPSTWAEHRSKVEVHLVPAIGQVPLQRLTPGHLNTLYTDLLERGLSARTVLHVHATIRRALADATRWGLVPRNVALLASPPRPGRTELQVWTAADLRSFLAFVEDDRLYGLWLLAASTGMRRGELLGLQWPDVDLGRARVAVRRSLVTVGHQVIASEPKTAKGRRSVALDPATVAGLKAWRKHQTAERLAWGPAWTDSGLVFTREDGRPLHPREVTRAFTRQVLAAELPIIRLHDLRHTHATLPWPPASTQRSSRSGSGTPTSPSPWTPTRTPCRRSRRRRPAPWPGWCSAREPVRTSL